MSDEYYIAESGKTKGPFSKAQLRSMWEHGLITSDTQYWTHGLDDWYLVANLLEGETRNEMGDPSGQTSVGYQTSPASNAPNLPQNVVASVEQSSSERDRGGERKPGKGVDAPKQKLGLGCFGVALAIAVLIAGTVWYEATTKSQQRPTVQVSSDESPERRASNELIKGGDYAKAIETDPQNPAPYLLRGRARFREAAAMGPYIGGIWEEMNDAVTDFQKCVELDPTSVNAYYFRGLALATRANWSVTGRTDNTAEALKDLESALSDFAKALELRPEHPDIVRDAQNKFRKIYEVAKAKFEEDESKAESRSPSQYLDRIKKFNNVMIETQLALEDVYQRWQEGTLYQSNDWMSPLQGACLKQRAECESVLRVKPPPEYEEEFAMEIEQAKAFDEEAAAYLQFLNAFTMRNISGADNAFRAALQAGIRAHQINSLRESWWKEHPLP